MTKYNKSISHQRVTELLEYSSDTGIFRWRDPKALNVRPDMIAGSLNQRGHWIIGLDKDRYLAHRLAWLYVHGEFPDMDVTHKDGDKTNNRIDNLILRPPKASASGHKGIHYCNATSKWIARINMYGIRISVGSFLTLDEAVAARKAVENRRERNIAA